MFKILFRCPRCQTQVSVAGTGMDFVHQCNSGITALDQEDVPKLGNWTDYTGSDTISPAEVRYQNTPNKLMGLRPWVTDNAKMVPLTQRGANAQLYRVRQHLEYIEDINKVPQGPSNIDLQPTFNPDRMRKKKEYELL